MHSGNLGLHITSAYVASCKHGRSTIVTDLETEQWVTSR